METIFLNYLNDITVKYTAFKDFTNLCDAINYRPSIGCKSGFSKNKKINEIERKELTLLADAYDQQTNKNCFRW